MNNRLLIAVLTSLLGLCLLAPAAQAWPFPNASTSCEINPPVLKAWQQLRYDWYPQLPDTDLSTRIMEFPMKPEIAAQIQNFHTEHAEQIQVFRECLFQAYAAPAPDLSQYQEVKLTQIMSELAVVYPNYAQFSLSPGELIKMVHSIILSRNVTSTNLSSYYLRFALGQAIYRAQPLGAHHWRLWFDSYDYMLAMDFRTTTDDVTLYGYWQRKPQ